MCVLHSLAREVRHHIAVAAIRGRWLITLACIVISTSTPPLPPPTARAAAAATGHHVLFSSKARFVLFITCHSKKRLPTCCPLIYHHSSSTPSLFHHLSRPTTNSTICLACRVVLFCATSVVFHGLCVRATPRHRFQAMRLFIGSPVWTPLNRPQDDHPIRKEYVTTFADTLMNVEQLNRTLGWEGEGEPSGNIWQPEL